MVIVYRWMGVCCYCGSSMILANEERDNRLAMHLIIIIIIISTLMNACVLLKHRNMLKE